MCKCENRPKMSNGTIISLIILAILVSSCKNEIELELLEARKRISVVENKMEIGYDRNVRRDVKNGIEYGIIELENSAKIKYWFKSHDNSNNPNGMTLFELPDGSLRFIEGYFCCEVQLPNNGKFRNEQVFISEMEKVAE